MNLNPAWKDSEEIMDEQNDASWEMAVIFNKVNLYYFTGTMQEGMLLIPRMMRQPCGLKKL